MRLVVITAAALSLTGCAAHTMGAMRERPPAIVADSDKPTNVIGPCLVDASDNIGHATYVPTADGATMEVKVGMGGESIILAAEIKDQGQHRHVTIWRYKPVVGVKFRHAFERMAQCL